MVAYFSSKFTKQIHATFTASLLVICLVGTHWMGFPHSISHAHLQSQAESNSVLIDTPPSLNHSSDVCHLFDALTLAGFITPDSDIAIAFSFFTSQSSEWKDSFIAKDS
uniref:Uncharacterized protein n=1 Tax=Polynucleobacter necessarius subsp. necessarius (strain STIR1) TaxID=452638 RepID=B1XUN3_POLNS